MLLTMVTVRCPMLTYKDNGCWWQKRPKPSTTSSNCQLHISSPTSISCFKLYESGSLKMLVTKSLFSLRFFNVECSCGMSHTVYRMNHTRVLLNAPKSLWMRLLPRIRMISLAILFAKYKKSDLDYFFELYFQNDMNQNDINHVKAYVLFFTMT